MRILLSAYACEPNAGSEPGIGWRWAQEIARLGHEVVVLTRALNAEKIQKVVEAQSLKNISFVYYDCPSWMLWSFWLKFWPFGKRGLHLYWHFWHYPYHFFWQYGAYRKMRQLHRQQHFDLVHHITFGTLRRSSFLGELGVPFVLGPVGGGESNPYALNVDIGARGWISEILRDASFLITRLNPFIWRMFQQASRIMLKTRDSKTLVPRRFHAKTSVQLELGIDEIYGSGDAQTTAAKQGLRVLYVGRFLYWKGMGLGLRAFAEFAKRDPNATLTMIGSGPDEGLWRKLADDLGIASRVQWISWMGRADLIKHYQASDALLFPSLHDSSGNVVLESLSCGLPVVCLDLGGPAAVTDGHGALIVRTQSRTADQVIHDLAAALEKLSTDPDLLSGLRRDALDRSRQFLWDFVVPTLYQELENLRPANGANAD